MVKDGTGLFCRRTDWGSKFEIQTRFCSRLGPRHLRARGFLSKHGRHLIDSNIDANMTMLLPRLSSQARERFIESVDVFDQLPRADCHQRNMVRYGPFSMHGLASTVPENNLASLST
jgi:hypothetical protein